MKSMIWFREDLRIRDNPALHHACQHEQVVAVYIISHQAWLDHDIADSRKNFIFKQLHALSNDLLKLNISLQLIEVSSDKHISECLLTLMHQLEVNYLYFNKQYEFDEYQRDQSVKAQLRKQNVIVKSFHDQVIFPPGSILTQQGQPFKVFTPFKNAWLKKFQQAPCLQGFSIPKKRKKIERLQASTLNQINSIPHTCPSRFWSAGEPSAIKCLEYFINTKVEHYHEQRDYPELNSTSQLSPYLAAGIISNKTCIQATINLNQGAAVWLNELIWREFYKHITYLFPHVCKHENFKQMNDQPLWQNDSDNFQAWCEGKTGYPLIDAAMRQLHQYGWMHNRLRMVVAMFLTKDLLIDWRWGERYFMKQLIDGDFAANNGGWQWSAGVGVDAAPYFRVFNPITQSQRFDAQGHFIKSYLPELNNLDNKCIHFPDSTVRQQCHYPEAIVEHKTARQEFLLRYKQLEG